MNCTGWGQHREIADTALNSGNGRCSRPCCFGLLTALAACRVAPPSLGQPDLLRTPSAESSRGRISALDCAILRRALLRGQVAGRCWSRAGWPAGGMPLSLMVLLRRSLMAKVHENA